MTRLPAHPTFLLAGLYPAAPSAHPGHSLRPFPGVRWPRPGGHGRQKRRLLRRSSRPGPNMLDGLKMEENFQSAIETSASFSSLLGECSDHAPPAPLLSARPRSGAQLAGTHWATGELASHFLHSAEPPSVRQSLGPSCPSPTSLLGISLRAPNSPKPGGPGELARRRLSGK